MLHVIVASRGRISFAYLSHSKVGFLHQWNATITTDYVKWEGKLNENHSLFAPKGKEYVFRLTIIISKQIQVSWINNLYFSIESEFHSLIKSTSVWTVVLVTELPFLSHWYVSLCMQSDIRSFFMVSYPCIKLSHILST